MNPAVLAQWRSDAALMRVFTKSPEWAVLFRHLEAARDAALRHGDSQTPDREADILHWRSVRLGILDALALPDRIVTEAERVESIAKAAESRSTPKGRR